MIALGRTAAAVALLAFSTGVACCELVLTDHRSGVELTRLPLDAAAPAARIAFEHSVLGATVVDHYHFAPVAHLVEERFKGQGYGLPHTAGPGESLLRDGEGWRLLLNRVVQPLVVRPLPQQRMRLLLGQREWLLGSISTQAIEFQALGCPTS